MNRSSRIAVVLFSLGCVGLSSWGCATSNPRVAMVVGNAQYQHSAPLPATAHDAQAISDRLTELGWHVTTAIDLPAEAYEEARTAFESQIEDAKQAIFYYAGYSMQINGDNYIVPIEFDPDVARLQGHLISLKDTIDGFQRGSGQLAVLLDASRDNPLAVEYERAARGSRRAGDSRLEFGTGLAEMPARPGLFIAYSTAPGHVTLDGRGRNSPFARALLEYMDLLDQDIASILVLVRNQVVLDTAGTQVPWDHSSLIEPFPIRASPENATLP